MTSRLLVLMTISTTAMASWYDSSTEVSYAGDVIEGDTIVTSSGPSLADCQDLDWLNDTATTAEQADCVDLLEDEMQDRIDDAQADGTLRTGSRVFENSSGAPQEITVTRGPATEEAEHRASYYDPSDLDADESSYEADGDWISSCDEYAYQRFYEYSLFQQLSRSVDDRYRKIVDSAFDSGYVGAGAVGIEGVLGYDFETRDGTVLADDQFGPGPWEVDPSDSTISVRPKNTFFGLTDDEIDAIELIDATMAATLREGQLYWRTSDTALSTHSAPASSGTASIDNRWRFHEVQSARLAGSSDAMLEYYRGKRAEFAKVLEHRRRLLSDGVSPLDVGDWVYSQELDETISGIDTELYNLLVEAEALGCLTIATTDADRAAGTYDFHACDWAPQDFHDEVVIEAESMKQEAILECEATADFAALATDASYEWYDTDGNLHSEVDPRGSAADFRLYLQRMAESQKNYIEHQVSSYDVQSRGIPWNSFQWSGGETYGDTDYFAAEWNAGIAWHIFDTAGGEVCDVNPYFKATGDFVTHVFGSKTTVLDAVVDFHVRRDRRIVDFEVLGFDLIVESWESQGLTYDRRIDYSYTYDKTWEQKKTFAEAKTTFMVWVIPFTVQGGVSGRIGVNYGFDAQIKEQTRDVYDANGNLVPADCWELYGTAGAYARPYAALDGKASMGIGVPGFSAGAYGRLTLLMVSLPTRVELEATALPDLSDIEIDLGVTSDLEVETLSGEVGLYADIFFKRHEKELFRWRGLRHTTPLIEADYAIELQVWGGVCTLPGIDCAG